MTGSSGLTVAYEDLWVPWYSGAIHCTVWFGFVEGRKCFFIEPHSPDSFFDRGHFYGSHDDAERFAFFSKAALEFMLKSGKRPDVIHCHDWQTALVPVLLYEIYQHLGMDDQRVCYTIHNFSHQGIAGESVLWATGPDATRVTSSTTTGCATTSTRRDQPDEGRHRLLELRHDGLARSTPGRCCYTDQGHAASATRCTCTAASSAACSTASTTTCGTRRSIRGSRARYGPDSIDDKYANKEALRDRFLLRDELQADRRLRRPARPPEGRAPDPPRDLLRAGAGRAVRAAGIEPRPGDQRPLLAPQAPAQRQSRLSTWSCSSATSSRT